MQTRRTELAIDLPATAGGEADHARAVLVRPDDDRRHPGVVMLHEIFGLDEQVLRQADRLAARGYLVLVPDLIGEGNRLGCMIRVFRSIAADQGRPFDVIEACRQVLLTHPDCTGRIGVIGFCFGGGFALLTARRGFQASAVNYGRLPDDLDAALVGSCPIVASYGLADKSLPGAARRLGEALKEAEIPHDVKEYPGAGHAFLNDEMSGPKILRPVFRATGVGPDPEAAKDAWARIERFFERYLGD